MERFVNTAGPCNPEDHYMLPWEERLPSLEGLGETLDPEGGHP
jgi:hypothetical protein